MYILLWRSYGLVRLSALLLTLDAKGPPADREIPTERAGTEKRD
jgi:hypothetical protein